MATATHDNPSLRGWLTVWRTLGKLHRYETSGLEPLLEGRSCLLVGYHGRPIAWDLLMLTAELHGRLGYLPHGIIHDGFGHGPLKDFIDALGFVTADGPDLAAAVERGEHILVAPGGTMEGSRSGDLYRVHWGKRTGYLKLALRYGLPVVPVAAAGVDEIYRTLNDGMAWGKRLHMPARLPFWLGLGPLGLWPFSPPFPVKVRQRVGTPVDVRTEIEHLAQLAGTPMSWQDALDKPEGRPLLAQLHQRIAGDVQAILDDLTRTRPT